MRPCLRRSSIRETVTNSPLEHVGDNFGGWQTTALDARALQDLAIGGAFVGAAADACNLRSTCLLLRTRRNAKERLRNVAPLLWELVRRRWVVLALRFLPIVINRVPGLA